MDFDIESLAKLSEMTSPKTTPVGAGDIDFYNLAAAEADNQGLSEFERDFKNLDYLSLISKYDKNIVDNAIRQQSSDLSKYIYDLNQNRDFSTIAQDSALGALQGFIGSAGGLLSLGASSIPGIGESLGTSIASGTNAITQGLQDLKSEEFKRMQRAYSARESMLDRESDALYKKDLQEGSSLRANLRKLGRDALNSASNLASEGAIAGDIGAQALGSLALGGPTSKAARGLAEGIQLARAKALGNLNPITRAQIAKNTAKMPAWLPTTMALEGGGGYTSGVQDIMEMPLETLTQNPDFVARVNELKNQNVPEDKAIEQARMELADTVGKSTAAMAAITAAGLNKFSKWSEAPFAPRSFVSKIGNVASEAFDESAQGVGTQLGQNLAVQMLADANRSMVEDVGKNFVEGAVGGALSSGATQAPGTIASIIASPYKMLNKDFSSKEKSLNTQAKAEAKELFKEEQELQDDASELLKMEATLEENISSETSSDGSTDITESTSDITDIDENVKNSETAPESIIDNTDTNSSINDDINNSEDTIDDSTESDDLLLNEDNNSDSEAGNTETKPTPVNPPETSKNSNIPDTSSIIKGRGADTWKDPTVNTVKVGGAKAGSKYEEGILTRPGTSPNTWNGQNISEIRDPKGGKALGKFYSGNGSEYVYSENGMTRRVKFWDPKTKGRDSGVNNWLPAVFLNESDLLYSYLSWDSEQDFYTFKGRILDKNTGKIWIVDPDTNKWRPLRYSDIYTVSAKSGKLKDEDFVLPLHASPKAGDTLIEFYIDDSGRIINHHLSGGIAYVEPPIGTNTTDSTDTSSKGTPTKNTPTKVNPPVDEKQVITDILSISDDEFNDLSDTAKKIITKKSKVHAILDIMAAFSKSDLDDDANIDLLQDYFKLNTAFNAKINSEEFKQLPKDSPNVKVLSNFLDIKDKFENNPANQKKLAYVLNKVKAAQLSSSPRTAIKATRVILSVDPMSVREENLTELLKQIEGGEYVLSENEQKSLKIVQEILAQKRNYLNSVRAKGLSNVDEVTENIFTLSTKDNPSIAKNSIAAHLSNLIRAINTNDYRRISKEVAALNKWANAFEEKVKALNRSGDKAKRLGLRDAEGNLNDLREKYSSYNSEEDKEYIETIYINPSSKNSIGLASVVFDEYAAFRNVFNALNSTYKLSLTTPALIKASPYIDSLIKGKFGNKLPTSNKITKSDIQQEAITEEEGEFPSWEEPISQVEEIEEIDEVVEDQKQESTQKDTQQQTDKQQKASKEKEEKKEKEVPTKKEPTVAQGTKDDPIYAGIGSRKTPKDVLALMHQIGHVLGKANWTLRSGGAKGADSAFEVGAGNSKKEIYYADDIAKNTYSTADKALETVTKYHPAPERLSGYARNLMARNSYQVFGGSLGINSNVIITYTPLDRNGVPQGGSAQALRMATDKNIPVLNLYEPNVRRTVENHLKNGTFVDYLQSISKFNSEESKQEEKNLPEKSLKNKDPNLIREEKTILGYTIRIYSVQQGSYIKEDRANKIISIAPKLRKDNGEVVSTIDVNKEVLDLIGISPDKFHSLFTNEEDNINFIKNYSIGLIRERSKPDYKKLTNEKLANLVLRALSKDQKKLIKDEVKIKLNENTEEQLKANLEETNAFFKNFKNKLFIKSILRKPVQQDTNLINVSKKVANELTKLGIPVTLEKTKKSYYGLVDPKNLQQYLDSLKEEKLDFSKEISKVVGSLLTETQEFFKERFNLKPTSNISILNTVNPVETAKQLVKDSLGEEVSKLYAQSLDEFINSVKQSLNANIQNIVAKNPALLNDLKKTLSFNNRKHFVFLTRDSDGNLKFNDQILDSVLVATHLYFINNPSRTSDLDEEDILRNFGLSAIPSKEFIIWANEADEVNTLVNSITNMVTSTTGLSGKSSVPEAVSSDAIKALVLDVLTATAISKNNLVEARISPPFKLNLLKSIESDPSSKKDDVINFYGFVIKNTPNITLSANANNIRAVLDPEGAPTVYFNDNIPLAETRDPKTGINYSKKIIKAIKNRNSVGYVLDPVHTAWLKALGVNNAILLKTSNIPLKYQNINFRQSQEGVTTSVKSAYASFELDIAQRAIEASESNMSIFEVKKHYPTRITSVGRFQENDANGPVATKMTREYSVCVTDVVDLSNYTPGDISTKNNIGYTRGLAQAFGIKVHNLEIEDISTELKNILESARPIVNWFKNWIISTNFDDLDSVAPLSEKDAKELKKLFTDLGNSDVSSSTELVMKALLDYARLEIEQEKGNADQHTTSTYLEADGVTNGTANSLLLFSTGSIDENYISNLGRVGIAFGKAYALKDLKKIFKKDMYGKAGEAASEKISEAITFKQYDKVRFYLDNLLNLINFSFDASNFKLPENGKPIYDSFEFSRSFIKNPFTVINYGSGTGGIAQKVLHGITGVLDDLYEKLSIANYEASTDPKYQGMKFEDAFKLALFKETDLKRANAKFDYLANTLYNLGNVSVRVSKKDGSYYVKYTGYSSAERINEIKRGLLNPKEFTAFDKGSERTTAEFNIKALLTDRMSVGFNSLLGENLTNTMKSIQLATSDLSLIHKLVYGISLLRAIKANPDGISKDDINKLKDSFKDLSAIYESKSGEISLTKEESLSSKDKKTLSTFKIPKGNTASGKSINMVPSIDTSLKIPTSVGVAGRPLFTVSNGDAEMMYLLSEVKDALLVFDGFNMPISKIDSYNELANKAVYDSFIDSDVLSETVEKFDRAIDFLLNFVEENPSFKENFSKLGTTPEEQAIVSSVQKVFSDKETQNLLEMIDLLTQSRNDLVNRAKEIRARLLAFKDLGVSVDQLAASENPYYSPGLDKDALIKDGISPEILDGLTNPDTYVKSATEALNILYAKHLDELNKSNKYAERIDSMDQKENTSIKETVSEEVNKEIVNVRKETPITEYVKQLQKVMVVSKDITNLSEITLENLIKKLPKTMQKDFLSLKINPNHKIFFGNKQFLEEQLKKEGAQIPDNWVGLCANTTRNIYILVDENNPITTDTAVTLLHELVHSATNDRIANYVLGVPAKTNEEKLAYKALDGIVEIAKQLVDTLNTSAIFKLSKDDIFLIESTGIYYDNSTAQWKMPDITDKNKLFKLVSELITVGLTEKSIAKFLKSVQASTQVRGIFTKLKNLIKEFLFKGFRSNVPKSLYRNLVWATQAITYSVSSETSENSFSSPRSINSKVSQDKTISIGDKYRNALKTIINISKEKGIAAYASKNTQILEESVNAQSLLDKAKQLGFKFTEESENDFKSIFIALKAGAKIPSISKMRLQNIFESIVDKLYPEDFLKESEYNDQSAMELAKEKVDFIKGIYDPKITIKDSLPLLIALSASNTEVNEVLSKLEPPKAPESKSRTTLDKYLDDLGNKITDTLINVISDTKNESNISDIIYTISSQVEKETVFSNIALSSELDQNYNKAANKANNFLLNAREVIGEKIWNTLSRAEKEVSNKFAKKCIKFLADFTEIISKGSLKNFRYNVIKLLNESNLNADLKTLIKDILGNDARGGRIEAIVQQTKAFVQRLRTQYRELIPQTFKNIFKEASEDDWKLMYKGFGKADITILNKGVFSDFADLFKNPKNIASNISSKEELIKSIDPKNFDTYIRKSKELALYMMTGKISGNLLRNASAIASLYGETIKGPLSKGNIQLENAIDELVSLYALQQLSKEELSRMDELCSNYPDKVKMILGNLKEIRRQDLDKYSSNSIANRLKGYMPSIATSNVQIVIDKNDPETKQKYLSLGYTYLQDYNSEIKGVGLGYYSFPVNTKAMYQQGGFQNVNISSGGVNIYTGYSVDPFTKVITDREVLNKFRSSQKNQVPGFERAIPVYNSERQLIAVEFPGDPSVYSVLNRDTNLANMLGVYLGRLVEEEKAVQYNNALLEELYYQYKGASPEEKKTQYINIYESKDPIIKDSLMILSETVKTGANTYFGPKFLPIRKDMIEDVIGVRRASVGDFWTGKSRWSPEVQKTVRVFAESLLGKDAYRKLLQAENFLQKGIAEARSIIVIKSLVVSYYNIASNVVTLIGNGVPPVFIIKNILPKLFEIESYVRKQLQLIELEVKINAIPENYRQRVQLEKVRDSIKNSLQDYSISYLIDRGEFSTIADIGITTEDLDISSGRLLDVVEQSVNNLPEIPKTVLKYSLVSKDTSFYKLASKSVQYGDFIAKSILFDYLTKVKGYSKGDAANEVRDEFVNYDLSTGRTRGYLEASGILWFWNYALRSSRTALKMLAKNPFYALVMFGVTLPFEGISTPLEDNIISKGILGSLGYSIGPEQALNAPGLNPFINVLS